MSKHKTHRSTKKVMFEEQQPENIEFYDPDDAQLDTYKYNQINDPQYNNLLGQGGISQKKKRKTNSYFQEDDKYKGKRYREEQVDDELQQQEEQQQDKKDNSQTSYKKIFNEIKKKRKIDTNLLEEKIREIKQEDQQIVPNTSNKQMKSEAANCINNQLKTYQNIQEIRYNFEKTFQEVKRYPFDNIPNNKQLNEKNRELQTKIVTNLDYLIKIQSVILQKTHQKNQLKQFNLIDSIKHQINQQKITAKNYVEKSTLDIINMYQTYKLSTKQIDKQIQSSLIKWSNKTALLNHISQSNYSSLIMQTPIGQAKKIFTGIDKVLTKSQMKRKIFKILFKQAENIKQTSDPQIFDDFDLFHEISKAYQKQIQKDEDGLLISETRKYLKQRNNKQGVQKKDVDRKASKNRKLRFNVHPKLLNFTTCQDNPYLIQARDQIIKNIFNSGPKDETVDYIDL